MGRAAAEKSKQATPEVLRFNARLEELNDRKGSRLVLRLPAEVSRRFPEGNQPQVEGTINTQPFRAPLDGDPAGGHWLRVNKAMSEGAGAAAGDKVELAILGPEPQPSPPADMLEAFKGSAAALELWDKLEPHVQRDWIRWIELAKKAETRERRVVRTIEQLEEGKRRPCCVNFYEYMLCRVQED